MTATPKIIQIFLPGGDPRGIRVAEITARIVPGNTAGGIANGAAAASLRHQP